jgi:dTDP-4-amino-4,6-dideoxygalactose transaminase
MNKSTKTIPFARPDIGAEEEKAVLRVLKSGWLTTGPEAAALEKEFAQVTGSSFALAVNSATSGLHILLESLGMGPGDYAVVPSYTYVATAHAVLYTGAEVRLADSMPLDYRLSPESLEDIILRSSQPPKAVILVPLAGHPMDVSPFLVLQKKYGFDLIEDAAHAFPSKQSDKHQGTLTAGGVFSFYANKTLTTGEGGMVVTDREDLAETMNRLRSNGIDRGAFDRFTNPRSRWDYQVQSLGYKYNMPDVLAAIGRVQLRRHQETLAKRKKIFSRYCQELKGIPGLTLPVNHPDSSYHLFQVAVDQEVAGGRDALKHHLSQAGIGTSVHYRPVHTMPYYAQRYGYKPQHLPRAYQHFLKTLSLPLYPDLSPEDQNYVLEMVQEFFKLNS